MGIFREDDGLCWAIACAGRAVVLAVLGILDHDLFPFQGIDTEEAEVMAFATVDAATLVYGREPGILTWFLQEAFEMRLRRR